MAVFLLIAAALAAQGPSAAARERPSPVIAAFDAWERCALRAAFAAAPRIADDEAAARHGLGQCLEQGRAFGRLYIRQDFVRFGRGVRTDAQRIEAAMARVAPSIGENIVRNLPRARRMGARKVELVHPD